MRSQGFSLRSFPAAASLPEMKITGMVDRRGSVLAVEYYLRGLTETISVPDPAAAPARRDGLWQDTCFELFLCPEGSDRYWEFNFSPSGHWNVYGFEACRQGMCEEQAFSALPLSFEVRPDALHLSVELDLEGIIPRDQPLKVGISAVIRSGKGECTYWALTHPGTQPDFHRKDCFVMEC